MNKHGIIILAAGSSSRLGRPKQLLMFGGKSLLRHTVDEAVKAAGKQVMVVTGAHKEIMENELRLLPVHVVHNACWREGMSSSVYTGLIRLINIFPYLDAAILAVCDQPFITARLFRKMIAKQQETAKGIVASAYNKSIGVPVLFSHPYFSELLSLQGQEGAKALLNKFKGDLTAVEFVKGGIDIDTPEDETKLQAESNSGNHIA